ncbi:MAG: ABC transporter permease [Candidatus Acidiferrales bacterium]
MNLRKRMLADLDQDIRDHIERETQANIDRGMSPDESRYAALRKFGNVTRATEDTREVWILRWLEDLLQDIRFALRMLRKNPGFTAVAVLTLALGIGANTAIFSVVNAVLLRPLPYPSPDRIVAIHGSSPMNFFPQPTFHWVWADWADHTQSFENLSTYETGNLNLAASGAEPERIAAAEVSQSFFQTFGIDPVVGRTFLREEEIPNHPFVAVISATLCRRFGDPREVIGRTLLMNGKPTVIIGVMPFGFEFPEKSQAWLPAAWNPSDEVLLKQAFFFEVVGRLKRVVSTAQAREELTALESHSRDELKKSMPGRRLPNMREITVTSLHDQLVGSSRPALLLLLGAVGFVLLIACADVANLLLARAVQRQREIALRAALGASRLRLIRQGLTESVLLSSIGGVGGLALAYWSLHAIRRFIPAGMLFVQTINLDIHVLLFLMGVSILSGLIFGLFPVLHALRVDLNEPLKEGAASSPARHSLLGRTRSFLAVAEIAMALVLLAGAGLLIKSFWRLVNVETGFHPESVLTANITLPFNIYQKPEQRNAFFGQTLQRISALPGVAAASYVSDLPFGKAAGIAFKVQLEQETAAHQAKQDENFASFYGASTDYFRAMGIPLIAGRVFNDGDRAGAPPVVIINNTIAQMFWPGENPLGRRISLPGSGFGQPINWAEIVGIVGDTKHRSLAEDISPEYYIPLLQTPPAAVFLVVCASGDPGASISAIRQTIAQVDSTLPLSAFMSMTDRVSESVAEPRFRTLLLGIFAGLALVLAAAGIYGVMAYSVAQRTHEIGIRIALGAGRRDVLSLVLGHSLRLTLVGVAIGLASAWGLTRFLASTLYAVAPHDMTTLAAVSVLLSAVALLASYIPARRAMRVDPVVALRYE